MFQIVCQLGTQFGITRPFCVNCTSFFGDKLHTRKIGCGEINFGQLRQTVLKVEKL